MKGLVLKILRGTYPSIPTNYSPELRDLIAEMLTKEPSKRPSIKKILEKDFLSVSIFLNISQKIRAELLHWLPMLLLKMNWEALC
jgi:Protein kinase domain.